MTTLHAQPGPTRDARRRDGTATVEFAIVAPLMLTLLFGIIEFGTVFRDYISISEAAREGARVASVGNPTATIQAAVTQALPSSYSENTTVAMQYRTQSGGSWSDWTTLADNGQKNAAPSGAQIKISVTYLHTLVTGQLFSRLADPGTNHITVASHTLMRRE